MKQIAHQTLLYLSRLPTDKKPLCLELWIEEGVGVGNGWMARLFCESHQLRLLAERR